MQPRRRRGASREVPEQGEDEGWAAAAVPPPPPDALLCPRTASWERRVASPSPAPPASKAPGAPRRG
eukprot:8855029-Pyramimonas_sp.AAC.1